VRSSLVRGIVVTAAVVALYGSTRSSASAAITASFVPRPISQAAINADPALANMQSWSLMATNTDGHWASAGLRLTLPAGHAFYQTPATRGGGDTHPNPAILSLFPDLEFDTYICSARNQTGQNPPAILGSYPENDPPLSFGGATDPVPGRFSVSWGDPQATSGPGPGTYEILRITFPLGTYPSIAPPGQTSQVAPDQTIIIDDPEPHATGLLLVVVAGAVTRTRRQRAG
jgi:hypothetical protein